MDMSRHHCTRCGRPLTSTTSITRGAGPTCARRIREATTAAAGLTNPDTLAKALEDIEDGAIIDTHRRTSAGRRVFAVVSSNGTDTYLATTQSCVCRAGLKGRVCRHRIAATLIAA